MFKIGIYKMSVKFNPCETFIQVYCICGTYLLIIFDVGIFLFPVA